GSAGGEDRRHRRRLTVLRFDPSRGRPADLLHGSAFGGLDAMAAGHLLARYVLSPGSAPPRCRLSYRCGTGPISECVVIQAKWPSLTPCCAQKKLRCPRAIMRMTTPEFTALTGSLSPTH